MHDCRMLMAHDFIVHTIQYTLYSIDYTVYGIHYTVYTIQYTLYSIHYTVYSIHYTVYYTVYTAEVSSTKDGKKLLMRVINFSEFGCFFHQSLTHRKIRRI